MFAIPTISTALIVVLVQLMHHGQAALTSSIEADPIFVRVIGDFDPRIEDLFFISALQTSFDDYYQMSYSEMLYGYDIAATFIMDVTLYEYDASSATSMIISWCEIQAGFVAPNDLDTSVFSIDTATRFVTDFFSSQHSDKLLNRLKKRSNITITTMEAFSSSSDVVQSALKGYVSVHSGSTSTSKSITVLASISITILCFAGVALLVSTLKRLYCIKKEDSPLGIRRLECTEPSAFNGELKPPTTGILDDTASDVGNESDAHSDDSTAAVDEAFSLKRDDPPIVSSESFYDDEYENETVVTTNQMSFVASQHNSPTTTANSDSPVWSIFSGNIDDQTASPYSSEEILKKRYRWHDNEDDVDIDQLLSLPLEPISPGTSSYASSNNGSLIDSETSNMITPDDT
jgi:hypothetical protein